MFDQNGLGDDRAYAAGRAIRNTSAMRCTKSTIRSRIRNVNNIKIGRIQGKFGIRQEQVAEALSRPFTRRRSPRDFMNSPCTRIFELNRFVQDVGLEERKCHGKSALQPQTIGWSTLVSRQVSSRQGVCHVLRDTAGVPHSPFRSLGIPSQCPAPRALRLFLAYNVRSTYLERHREGRIRASFHHYVRDHLGSCSYVLRSAAVTSRALISLTRSSRSVCATIMSRCRVEYPVVKKRRSSKRMVWVVNRQCERIAKNS